MDQSARSGSSMRCLAMHVHRPWQLRCRLRRADRIARHCLSTAEPAPKPSKIDNDETTIRWQSPPMGSMSKAASTLFAGTGPRVPRVGFGSPWIGSYLDRTEALTRLVCLVGGLRVYERRAREDTDFAVVPLRSHRARRVRQYRCLYMSVQQ